MSTITILRSQALLVFIHCGWKSSDKWDNERMGKKLKDVPDVLDTSLPYPDDATKEAVDLVLDVLKKGGSFVVSDSAEPAAAEPAAAEPAAAEPAAAEPAEKKKRGRKPKPESEKSETGPKEPTRPREKKSRVYAAGVVLKKHGLSVPLTEEMAKEVDEICGRPNQKESMAWLQVGWHLVNGYTQTFVPGD